MNGIVVDQDRPDRRSTKLKRIDAQPLPEAVADRIVQGIAAGRFRPGERLVDGDISAELQVSRIPVRAAFKALEKQGILVHSPHRGCRVMTLTDKKVRQVFQVRSDLELRACADLIEELKRFPGKLDDANAILKGMHRHVMNNDKAGVAAADMAFHRWICRASENQIVCTLWEALAHHLTVIFGIIGDDWDDLQSVYDDHCGLRDLLAAGDSTILHCVMQKHLLEGFIARSIVK